MINSTARRLVCVLALFILAASFAAAQSNPETGSQRFALTPYAGLYATVFTTEPSLVDGLGLAAGVKADYRIWKSLRLGAGLGVAAMLDQAEVRPLALYSLLVGLELGTDTVIGLELGFLPGLSLSLGTHHFGLSLLPIYMTSGGSTALIISYGYRFFL